MVELKDLATVYLAIFFIVPGLVIVYVRSRFVSGPRPSQTDNVLGYTALSIIYYAFTIPFLQWILNGRAPFPERVASWISLTVLGPAAFGLLLGASAQKGWGALLANKIGLSTIQVIPTAWDWRFSKIPRGGMFVMVTLNSGETVAGFFGPKSFASSDTKERDFYMEEEYNVSDEGVWSSRPAKVGILIPMAEIRHIEFWEP